MQPGSALRCQLIVGSILQRTCNRASSAQCAHCGRPACAAHLRSHGAAADAALPWCVECLRQLPTSSRSGWDSSGDPSPNLDVLPVFGFPEPATRDAGSEPTWEGGGGEFGGGGASGGWDEPGGFSPADYAAFDRTVEADRDTQHGSYDS